MIEKNLHRQISLRVPLEVYRTLEDLGKQASKSMGTIAREMLLKGLRWEKGDDEDDEEKVSLFKEWLLEPLDVEISPLAAKYDTFRPVEWPELFNFSGWLRFETSRDEIKNEWYLEDIAWIQVWIYGILFGPSKKPNLDLIYPLWDNAMTTHPAIGVMEHIAKSLKKTKEAAFTELLKRLHRWINEGEI